MRTEQLVELKPGDATFTRRILKRYRQDHLFYDTETEAVSIGKGGYGSKIVCYKFPKSVCDEEVERREAELHKEREKEESQHSARLLEQRNKQISRLTQAHPNLSPEKIEEIVDSGTTVYSQDAVGYQHGRGTKSYWKKLGFRATGKPQGILIKGKTGRDLYDSQQLKPIPTSMTSKDLKTDWLAKYGSEKLVLAYAIRIANRLQKVSKIKGFYELKDKWISRNQDYLAEGRVARVENKICWGCNGTGNRRGHSDYDGFNDDDLDEDCYRCDGTGLCASRTL